MKGRLRASTPAARRPASARPPVPARPAPPVTERRESVGRPAPAPRSARETVLAEWRGIDLAPLEKASALVAQSIGHVLPAAMKRVGLDRKRADAELVKVWSRLLDPRVVAHAQPAGLRNGTLFVTVDSHVWLDEIVRYRRKEILERLQHSFGRETVARISFRVG